LFFCFLSLILGKWIIKLQALYGVFCSFLFLLLLVICNLSIYCKSVLRCVTVCLSVYLSAAPLVHVRRVSLYSHFVNLVTTERCPNQESVR